MPTSTAAPSSDSSGFTLLELAVVLLILGISASFLVPRLRDPESAALVSSAERLATTARYLYDEAAYQRLPMRLNLDLDRQTYFVTVLGGAPDAPEFVPVDSALARPVALPDSVAFRDVVLPAVGTVTEGIVFAQFSPEGWADPLVVHLRGRSGGDATVAMEPLTGRTRIADRYVVLEPDADDARDRERNRGRDDARPSGGSGMRSSRAKSDAAP